MKLIKISIIIIFLSLFSFNNRLISETPKEKAHKIALKGIELTDKGEYVEAIKKFLEAEKLDPENIAYPYERSLAYYKREDYESVVEILEPLIKRDESNELIYQLLGNSYDFLERKDEAISIYDAGLEKFPDSGRLYFERGLTESDRDNNRIAMSYWEKGIKNDPAYHNNYYGLALYYARTAERVWAVHYGEIFLNLSTDIKKNIEISENLYETYTGALLQENLPNGEIEFTAIKLITESDIDLEFLPFQIAFQKVFQKAFLKNTDSTQKTLTIKDLYNIRKDFVLIWFEKGLDTVFQNVVIDFHKKLINNEMFESYNYWLFQSVLKDEFKSWFNSNKKQFEKFYAYISKNYLKLDKSRCFHRFQYEEN